MFFYYNKFWQYSYLDIICVSFLGGKLEKKARFCLQKQNRFASFCHALFCKAVPYLAAFIILIISCHKVNHFIEFLVWPGFEPKTKKIGCLVVGKINIPGELFISPNSNPNFNRFYFILGSSCKIGHFTNTKTNFKLRKCSSLLMFSGRCSSVTRSVSPWFTEHLGKIVFDF